MNSIKEKFASISAKDNIVGVSVGNNIIFPSENQSILSLIQATPNQANLSTGNKSTQPLSEEQIITTSSTQANTTPTTTATLSTSSGDVDTSTSSTATSSTPLTTTTTSDSTSSKVTTNSTSSTTSTSTPVITNFVTNLNQQTSVPVPINVNPTMPLIVMNNATTNQNSLYSGSTSNPLPLLIPQATQSTGVSTNLPYPIVLIPISNSNNNKNKSNKTNTMDLPKKNSTRANKVQENDHEERPLYYYSQLIVQAFTETSKEELTAEEIFSSIKAIYPFYRNKDKRKNFMTAIKTTLNQHSSFLEAGKRVTKGSKKMYTFWKIDPQKKKELINGSTKVRQNTLFIL